MTLQNLSILNKNPLNMFLKLLKFKIKGQVTPNYSECDFLLLTIRLTVDGLGQFDQTDTSTECKSNLKLYINK